MRLKRNILFVSLLVFAHYFVSCTSCRQQNGDGNKVETFSEAMPYAIEIKKERSYYQAEKIAQRLIDMGLGAYVLQEKTEEGLWYKVVSGALVDSQAVESYKAKLDTSFGITDIAIVDYTLLDSINRKPVVKDSIQEKNRIIAKSPDVPKSIMDVISKYPDNNMFYLSSISILMLDNNSIKHSSNYKIDMPRGVTLNYLKSKGCQAMSSVIYKDNIYGDNVTLQVVRCKETKPIIKASILPSYTEQNKSAFLICEEIADMILATGKYEDENKTFFESQAYQKLSGFVVSFIFKNIKRSYYIFTDEAGEYIYMAQSTKNKDGEMFDFIESIGLSDGLVMYDEFYNSFYTISDEMNAKESFLGYYMEKLTWSYAKEKGYAKWAKKMVGHWQSSMLFENKDKGVWGYSIFDLLSDKQGQLIYNELYRGGLNKECLRIIYGTQGAAIRDGWGDLTEINYGYGRYVVALTPYGVFSERDLINRAEEIQLEMGGYKEKSTSDLTTKEL